MWCARRRNDGFFGGWSNNEHKVVLVKFETAARCLRRISALSCDGSSTTGNMGPPWEVGPRARVTPGRAKSSAPADTIILIVHADHSRRAVSQLPSARSKTCRRLPLVKGSRVHPSHRPAQPQSCEAGHQIEFCRPHGHHNPPGTCKSLNGDRRCRAFAPSSTSRRRLPCNSAAHARTP